MSHILAVFPHPDDESFTCGGTLAKYAEQGIPVTLVCATNGESGIRMGDPPFTTKKELPNVRKQELQKACEILGISECIFLHLPDKGIEKVEPELLTKVLIRIICTVKPSVMITCGPQGEFAYHPDHRSLGRCVTHAFCLSGNPDVIEKGYNPHKVSKLYYPVLSREYRQPEKVGAVLAQMTKIDITATWCKKVNALKAHLTQFQQEAWLWNEEAVKRKLPDWEGFIQYHKPYHNEENDFF